MKAEKSKKKIMGSRCCLACNSDHLSGRDGGYGASSA